MNEITDSQRFGNEILNPDQIQGMRYRFKQGESLNNLEIEKLLSTAEFAVGELKHVLCQTVVDSPTEKEEEDSC